MADTTIPDNERDYSGQKGSGATEPEHSEHSEQQHHDPMTDEDTASGGAPEE